MEEREKELGGGENQTGDTEGGDGGHESMREETGEGAGPPLRPSVLDIQLALERLCEDQSRDQLSESDGPDSLLEPHPEDHEESISRLHSPGKIVNELFKEAKEHGAMTAEEAIKSSEKNVFKAKSFTGGGYKLGDSAINRSEYIRDDELFPGGPDVEILLKLWSNGFSLDDGELRSYADPVNAQFLESIKKGEIPIELHRLVHSGQVSLDMEDHQDQEYIKPRLNFKAFSGDGKKLGSLTPEIISTPSSPEEEHKPFLNAEVELDEHVPTTKIQIRLADGTRLIQRFNLSHRIMDVRQFITQSRSEFAHTDFTLVTTFPNTELTDENQTLEEADLLNTVLLQKLK
ncbi:PREDICTED: UBX domain-containing protein 2B [Nanorana parkeri]|uniref:UBX domain-containing protein 2B n=1 Tax=Nanorana parkeri TaxID=125878 RepID=UPI00085506DC|nr:PREDICTED: UBX domain-containing protein 2B [Nanorana parkeri]